MNQNSSDIPLLVSVDSIADSETDSTLTWIGACDRTLSCITQNVSFPDHDNTRPIRGRAFPSASSTADEFPVKFAADVNMRIMADRRGPVFLGVDCAAVFISQPRIHLRTFGGQPKLAACAIVQ